MPGPIGRLQAAALSSRGITLFTRFERRGARADLDAAIKAFEAGVAASPAGRPGQVAMLTNLGSALRARFGQTGALADLDAAVEACQAAVDACPAGHRYRAGCMSNLGTTLRARFEHTGSVDDLDPAVEACQAAVDATPAGHPQRSTYLNNLGNALATRFGRTAVPADLDTAIEAGLAAVAGTSARHPDRAKFLSNLGTQLLARFELTGAQDDLDDSIMAGQAAVAATPAAHPGRAGRLSFLGTELQARFEQTGALADLDAAVEIGQAAVAATLAGDPDRAVKLYRLGNALQARFERTGALADLTAAIANIEAAADIMPAGDPDRPACLGNLGSALGYRFSRTGALADADAAVEACHAAVTAIPVGHPDRAGLLNNLGNALRARFRQTGALADLDAAVEAGRAAVVIVPASNPSRARYMSNLGGKLLTRFKQAGAQADLDEAVEVSQAAVDATPADYPDQAHRLNVLGDALRERFAKIETQSDRERALSAYVQSAELKPAEPSMRIRAARAGAALAVPSEPGQAARLLEMAVRLLGEVTPRQLERSDQQHALGGFAGLAGEAAALALVGTHGGAGSGERAARALGLLEAGRAVLLSQALDTRSDLTDLRRQHPELAARFAELRDLLDQPQGQAALVTALTSSTDRTGDWPGRAAQDRRRLAGEFTAVLERIRALEGFVSFGLPPSTGELLAQAAAGPVVTFNVNPYGSGALLLTEDGVTSLELPGLTYETVGGQIKSFYQALEAASDPGTSLPDRIAAQGTLLEILGWLWDTAAGPVLDALGYHRPPLPGAAWPRVWWAPGGLLSLLPVQAAGHHAQALAGDRAQRTVMDRVISSYTPTIRALQYARQHPHMLPAGRALIVAMPVTHGLAGGGELPNVPLEIARVRTVLPDTVLLAEPGATSGSAIGPSELPTRANVLDQLPGCAIAHFACHGASDPTDPSKSMLLLSDHDRDPLTVASLAPLDLGSAQLAYLSACETASTFDLLDEAIHLTTAFQLAGFPHVIGTLWEINDEIAVTIADTFYTALRTSPNTVDTRIAALALHDAVRAARDELPRTPSLWAAYIHAGA